MRCYLSVTPKEIQEFLNSGTFVADLGLTVTQTFADENPEADEEELEFDVSFCAAQISKEKLGTGSARGFALALEVPTNETGEMSSQGVALVKPLKWSFVEAVLVSDSEESELSWYAPQEVESHLADWLS
jgi:hypothetical protein